MEELKKMMREMAGQLEAKAKQLGMENFKLEVCYSSVKGEYEIKEIECIRRTIDTFTPTKWYFCQGQYLNDPWMDYTKFYNGEADEEEPVNDMAVAE